MGIHCLFLQINANIMPLTNAQKQRRYKEKLKACGKYDHFRERHRNEAQKSRAKQRHLESTLPSTMKKIQQEARRVATRRRVAAYRERRKTKEAMKKLPFSSAQAYAKATARVCNRLPETPHRRKTVCRNLCRSELGTTFTHQLQQLLLCHQPLTREVSAMKLLKLSSSFISEMTSVGRRQTGRMWSTSGQKKGAK
ncbi:hypothetical protein BSL78_16278 [Apostichopus japonicus]|uniref:Uncharacterized protein n=1 Tax=Stichopus japonicus TaxID=307972 RepID=A0A2G8KFT5_STIJA|nr:hypothetical protein BSL78_16278 [Apostichopus japonicus]